MQKIYSLLFTLLLPLLTFGQKIITFDATLLDSKEATITVDEVTMSCTNGNFNANEWRFYQGSTLTFSTAKGLITKVKFECNSTNKGVKEIEEIGEMEVIGKDAIWKGQAAKNVDFHMKKQVRAVAVEVTIEGEGIEPTPVLPDDVEEADIPTIVNDKNDIKRVQLTLTDAKVLHVKRTQNGHIYYVRQNDYAIALFGYQRLQLQPNDILNGKVTMAYKNVYGMPRMVETEDTNMDLLRRTESTVEAEPEIVTLETLDDEVRRTRYRCNLIGIRRVTITKEKATSPDGTKTFTNYFMVDAHHNKVQLYDGKRTFDDYCNDKHYDVVGLFDNIFYGQVEVCPLTIVPAGTRPVMVSAPIFSIDGGTYLTAQTLTLRAEEGTKIYYTLDGTLPSEASTLYTEPITIDASMTVRAIAINADGIKSEVAEATYKIAEQTNADEALFDFDTNKWGHEVGSADHKGGTFTTLTENGVTLTAKYGTSDARVYKNYYGKTELRVYKKATMTLTAPKGNRIIKIHFVFGQRSGLDAEGYDADTQTWTGAEEEVVFKATDRNDIVRIEVTLESAVGIDTVTTDNAKKVYYNLHGQRLNAQQAHGTVIYNGKIVVLP